MVRAVFILLWDNKYQRGLSDDICLFSAPIPTSTFIRVNNIPRGQRILSMVMGFF
jgi:hypothetical protein